MFKAVQQLTFRRFNSHHLQPSKLLNELAYKPNKQVGEEFIKKYEEKSIIPKVSPTCGKD